MSDYVEFKVQVSKEDIKDYLETFYSDEEIADMDIDDEAVEVMNGVFIGYGFAEYQRRKFHKRRRNLLEELTRISQEFGLYNTEPEGDKKCLTKK